MNSVLLLLFFVPFVFSAVTIVLLPKITQNDFDLQTSLAAAGGGLLISMVIITGAYYIGKGDKTADVEVLNGYITAKTRKQDSYMEPYDCNCRTRRVKQSNGSYSSVRECDTCWRKHYTVKWWADSTVGRFDIKSLDELDRSVYKTPDPDFFKTILIGESCSVTHSYTNYIKGVPESLFHFKVNELEKQFVGMIPAYPISIYSRWKIDRVLPVKVNVPDLKVWNTKLADGLRQRGPAKQVNAVIVLANTADPTYAYALQSAWLNGKKNDVVLIIGTTEFPQKAQWVKVLSFAKEEIFPIQLEQDILNLPELTADAVTTMLFYNIDKNFQRKPMATFEYLDAEIHPPNWVITTTILVVIAAYLAFWILAYRSAVPNFNRRSYR